MHSPSVRVISPRALLSLKRQNVVNRWRAPSEPAPKRMSTLGAIWLRSLGSNRVCVISNNDECRQSQTLFRPRVIRRRSLPGYSTGRFQCTAGINQMARMYVSPVDYAITYPFARLLSFVHGSLFLPPPPSLTLSFSLSLRIPFLFSQARGA